MLRRDDDFVPIDLKMTSQELSRIRTHTGIRNKLFQNQGI